MLMKLLIVFWLGYLLPKQTTTDDIKASISARSSQLVFLKNYFFVLKLLLVSVSVTGMKYAQ